MNMICSLYDDFIGRATFLPIRNRNMHCCCSSSTKISIADVPPFRLISESTDLFCNRKCFLKIIFSTFYVFPKIDTYQVKDSQHKYQQKAKSKNGTQGEETIFEKRFS